MNLETLMLRGLFIACLAVCALILGAMLNTTASVRIATEAPVNAPQVNALLQAPSHCALPADGLICPINVG